MTDDRVVAWPSIRRSAPEQSLEPGPTSSGAPADRGHVPRGADRRLGRDLWPSPAQGYQPAPSPIAAGLPPSSSGHWWAQPATRRKLDQTAQCHPTAAIGAGAGRPSERPARGAPGWSVNGTAGSTRSTWSDRAVPYNGRSYRSLSEIARVITGTRWSGPRFFGL